MQQRIYQDKQISFRFEPEQRERLLKIAIKHGDPETSGVAHGVFIDAAEGATRLWLDAIDADIDYWPTDDRYTLSGFKFPHRPGDVAEHCRKLVKPIQNLKKKWAELPDFVDTDLSMSLNAIAEVYEPRFFQAINKLLGYEEDETRTLPDVVFVLSFLEFLEQVIEFNIECNRDVGGVGSYVMKPLIVTLARSYLEIYQKDDIGIGSGVYFQVLKEIATLFTQTVSFPLAQKTIKKQIETYGGLVWV